MTTRTTKRSAGEPTWIDLMTPDLEVAKQFYRQVFGWEYLDTGADFGHYNMAMLQGRNAAGIGPMPPHIPMPSAWTVYFSSDDTAADVARAKALGGQVVADPMVIGDSGVMAVLTDPTGAVFGLWQAASHIGAAAENEHGAMTWWDVQTRDMAAASAFYTKLFNLSAQAMEGGSDYLILQRGMQMVCGVAQMDANWEGVPPHWMGYFTVDNTDAAVERAVAAGGKLVVPAFDMPYGRMAVLSDPAGATFSIVQPPAA
jgi:hypothetical protein